MNCCVKHLLNILLIIAAIVHMLLFLKIRLCALLISISVFNLHAFVGDRVCCVQSRCYGNEKL